MGSYQKMASLLFISLISVMCLLLVGNVDGRCSTEYGLMEREHRRCASNYPTVASLDQYRASGAQLVNIFRGYCQNLDAIVSCVRNVFTNAGCSGTDLQAFTSRAERSDYFCENGNIKPFISDIFQNIPTIGSYSSNDPCMAEARRGDEMCRNNAIANAVATGLNAGYEGFVRLMVGTMPCTLDHVMTNPQCPRQESVLTVSLRYGGVVVPPELGVNISQILLSMARENEEPELMSFLD